MSKQPPIPPEQRSFPKDKPHVRGAGPDRHEAETGLQSGQPGDADTNLHEQGRQGNMDQNLTHKGRQQDR